MLLKKHYVFGIVILGILIFSFGIGNAAATDDDNDGVDDDFEEENERNIQIEMSANEFQIESVLRNGEQKDSIELHIKYDSDGLDIDLGYESELSSDNSTELEIEFGVRFRSLIEFMDLDGNGIYDPSVDNTIQEVELNSFKPVIYTNQTISTGTTLHYFIVNTTDGVFTAHIYVVEEFEIVNETLITPTETKFDIEISDFNYLNGTSQLALYTKLESEIEYEEEDHTEDEKEGYASNEEGVIIKHLDYAGAFTWKENAMIDGVSKRVLTSTIEVDDEDENEQKIYLNYPRGSHIYHDPKVGVVLLTPFPALPVILSVSIISVVAVAVALILVLRKRRKE